MLKPIPYYMLYVRAENGQWFPQFGDYERSVVVQEQRDTYQRDYALKDIRIHKFASIPSDIECLMQGDKL